VADPQRARLARYAAPAAFLVAATIAIVLVRSGLEGGGDQSNTPTRTSAVSTTRTRTTTTERTTTTKRPRRRFYRIQSGDTLATVASEFGTTVEQLLVLNPNVNPNALAIGQKIRVR
jgi:LysM repeat protein